MKTPFTRSRSTQHKGKAGKHNAAAVSFAIALVLIGVFLVAVEAPNIVSYLSLSTWESTIIVNALVFVSLSGSVAVVLIMIHVNHAGDRIRVGRLGAVNGVIGLAIAVVVVIVVAIVAAYISGYLVSTLPSSITGYTFVTNILTAISTASTVFTILFVVIDIIAFILLIAALLGLTGMGGGGAATV